MNTGLSIALNEKDVENFYRKTLVDLIPDLEITSPYGCDGYGVSKKTGIKVLCEFKDDVNLKNKQDQSKLLAQSIFYIKKFEKEGKPFPTTIFIADRDECFVLHVNTIINYLGMDIDWSVAPSSAYKNLELMSRLFDDVNIQPFVFDASAMKDCVDKIKELTDNVVRKVRVTEHNVVAIFEYFEKHVLGNVKLGTNEKANLFIQIIINPNENYLHPKKKNALITKSFGEIVVNDRNFGSFFSHFEGDVYSPREKEKLTSIIDRLVEDTTRRKQGEFFTPTIWVDKAHEYLSNTFGEDWKEKYVVWDPAWGTGNLTRDYKFKELYCSTLNQSDIDTANQMGYNPEATKFQFDFLNDPDEKLPQALRDAIASGREIIVLMNPPYIKATPNKGNDSTGVSNTIIGREMGFKKMGIASSQLSTQFLFKITKLQKKCNNIRIAVFNKPNFMTSDGFKILRNYFMCNYGFVKGFLFNASHFSDTADSWGVSFSIWDIIPNVDKNNFKHNVLDIDNDYNITKMYDKILYNCDGLEKANKIFSKKEKNNIILPPIKSFITIDNKKEKLGNTEAIGYINNHSNNVMQQQVVFLASSVISANGNKSITKDRLYNIVNLFTARKSVRQNWINDKDEYLAPNENHEQYGQFTYDSIVYSLFNNSSQQSSLRQVEYKNKLWDIKNEFFWMSKEEMLELANTNHYTELYTDARTSNNRHVHNLLFGEERIYDKLSPDAKQVLDFATELTKKSIKARQMMADNHNYLNSWDAGYAQLKLVWKEYFPEEFKEFRQLYKNLEDRMRPLVYELGFLIK
jgi:hypothetical protein